MLKANVGRVLEACAALVVAALAGAGFVAVPHLVQGWAFVIPGTTDSAMAPTFFPRVALGVTATFALAVALTTTLRNDPLPLLSMTRSNWLRILALAVISVLYLAGMHWIGFVVSSTILMVVLPLMVGYRKVIPLCVSALVLPPAVALVFWYGLKVALPGSEIVAILAWFR